jgi:putative two-component system response regulator
MPKRKIEEGKILIIDDEAGNVQIFERILRGAGFKNITSITDSLKAVETYKKFKPDLVLLDLKMPNMDGFDVMAALKKVEAATYLPILVLTAQRDQATRLKALKSGAKDFISKPFEMTEAITRVRNMLEVSLLHKEVREINFDLEYKVHKRTKELEESRVDIIHRLARAAGYRDDSIAPNAARLGYYCSLLAEEMGMTSEQCNLIHQASPLHDIGKIGMPDEILIREEKLSHEELEIFKMHSAIGAEILAGSDSKLLQMAESICKTHEEKWDGSGYPNGLKGQEIPLEARILAVCVELEKLTHQGQESPLSFEAAAKELAIKSGVFFDPEVVETCYRVLPEIKENAHQSSATHQENPLNRFRPTTN